MSFVYVCVAVVKLGRGPGCVRAYLSPDLEGLVVRAGC